MNKTRMTCKSYCELWNDIDKDCEAYGENHPCPRKCPLYKRKQYEKMGLYPMPEMLKILEEKLKIDPTKYLIGQIVITAINAPTIEMKIQLVDTKPIKKLYITKE